MTTLLIRAIFKILHLLNYFFTKIKIIKNISHILQIFISLKKLFNFYKNNKKNLIKKFNYKRKI